MLIIFWATWCKPCIKEFPYENKLVEKYKDQPVEIFNICIDSEEEKWKSYLDKYDLKKPLIYSQMETGMISFKRILELRASLIAH